MKRLIKYCSVIVLFLVSACSDPSPTELIFDNTPVSENIDVEIISSNPDEVVYSTGYDSTGIVRPIPQHLSNIYVSGIKNSSGNNTERINYYSAVFFDGSQPIYNPHGRKLGFKTNNMGKVFFNNIAAKEVSHIVHIIEPGRVRDEIAGIKYEYYQRNSPNQFPFNSGILFTLMPVQMRDRKIEFEIQTPKEITGQVIRSGSRVIGDLKLLLKWDNKGDGNIEVIIGGIAKGRNDPFPLIRIKTSDDGELVIPASITKSIPFQNYNEIVFSFIRQTIKNDSSLSGLNDPNVIAQSIHNIKVVIQ
ncbi:MAG: hypothetical protein KJ571_02415 [Bacteroidetes bacterium]|nr:hypothetical protein [Bacteroidota bacterium]